MAVIVWSGFGGANKAISAKLLPDAVGVDSQNQNPLRGDFRPWKSATVVASAPANQGTIYRMGRDVANDANYWLSWPGTVHAVRGFDSADTTERTYFTGDGNPKVTDNTIALAGAPYPTASRPLGMPAPAGALTSTPGSGSSAVETAVTYVYTFVNDWGWESAPSPASVVHTRPEDAQATLSGFSSAPVGNYNITGIRIYKAQVTSTSSVDYFYLREIAYGTASTTDDNRDLGATIETTTWAPPPSDLSGLTALWNGMLAGISANTVRFCEPYAPYAWPSAYEIVPPDCKPVALKVVGQTLVVLTTGRPLAVAGTSPDSMDQRPIEFAQACVAPLSAVSLGTGVAWASEDGLCWVDSDGPKVLTAGIMTREDWQALNPSSMTGSFFEGFYFGSYDSGAGRKGFLLAPGAKGIYFLSTGYPVTHYDELKDQLYMYSGTSVLKWNAGTSLTATALSKVFRQPKPVNFGCAEVVADAYPVTLKVYADSSLKHTQVVTAPGPFRLPSGFLAQDWQLDLSSTNAVQAVMVAGSIAELEGV